MDRTATPYFAYGSNMSVPRLEARVGVVEVIATGYVEGRRLTFHKLGRSDRSGKCDIPLSEEAGARAWGVLYRLEPRYLPTLDHIEGLGFGYELAEVEVITGDGAVRAFTYVAELIDPDLRPYIWYLEHVRRGAEQHGLEETLAMLESVEAREDRNRRRHDREMAVYEDVSGSRV